jgi:hypothetical protein
MTRSSTGKTVEERTAYWRERIAEQERSGIPVQQFYKERGITEQSFYVWRKRLRKEPARFVLVETGPARQHAPQTGLELLVTGERLRISTDVDPSLLRRFSIETLTRMERLPAEAPGRS